MAITDPFSLNGKRFPHDIQSLSKQPYYPNGKRFPYGVKVVFHPILYFEDGC